MKKSKYIVIVLILVFITIAVLAVKQTARHNSTAENIRRGQAVISCEDALWLYNTIKLDLAERMDKGVEYADIPLDVDAWFAEVEKTLENYYVDNTAMVEKSVRSIYYRYEVINNRAYAVVSGEKADTDAVREIESLHCK